VSSESAVTRFQLRDAYRQELATYAQRQYSAEVVGDVDRAKRLRTRLRDGRNAVGMGAGRYVYPLPERAVDRGTSSAYVLKLAVPNDGLGGRDGREQNRREAETWTATRSRHLVPVVAADDRGYWLVMPRGDPVDGGPSLDQWADRARDALDDAVWGRDIGARNVVRLDGQFRLCDYGVS
jgi:hypothetical protein